MLFGDKSHIVNMFGATKTYKVLLFEHNRLLTQVNLRDKALVGNQKSSVLVCEHSSGPVKDTEANTNMIKDAWLL